MSNIHVKQTNGIISGVDRTNQWAIYNGEFAMEVGFLGYHAARELAESIIDNCSQGEIEYDYVKRNLNQEETL